MPKTILPELVIDLNLPARLPSRYRGKLVSVTRLEARVRFLFEPGVFRSGEVQACGAEILLVFGRQSVRLQGDLEPDGCLLTARVVFGEPIGLPDYSLLRKVCGLEEREDAAKRGDAPKELPALPVEPMPQFVAESF